MSLLPCVKWRMSTCEFSTRALDGAPFFLKYPENYEWSENKPLDVFPHPHTPPPPRLQHHFMSLGFHSVLQLVCRIWMTGHIMSLACCIQVSCQIIFYLSPTYSVIQMAPITLLNVFITWSLWSAAYLWPRWAVMQGACAQFCVSVQLEGKGCWFGLRPHVWSN